ADTVRCIYLRCVAASGNDMAGDVWCSHPPQSRGRVRTRDAQFAGGICCAATDCRYLYFFFFFQAEDGIRDWSVTGVQTCALPISYQSIVVCAARSLTALMPSCCFGHCSLGCEASRAFVRWFQFPTRLMRMP